MRSGWWPMLYVLLWNLQFALVAELVRLLIVKLHEIQDGAFSFQIGAQPK
jgi:hypothetical protein